MNWILVRAFYLFWFFLGGLASGVWLTEPPVVRDTPEPPLAEVAGYPDAPLAKVATKDGWVRPRAKIVGTVRFIRREDDGDLHIKLLDENGRAVILEIIPELPLKAAPKMDQKIAAWGIVRWDGEHGWGELHPLVGWEPTK